MTPYLLLRRLGFAQDERPLGIPPQRSPRWLALVVLADVMMLAIFPALLFFPRMVVLAIALSIAGFALHVACGFWSKR